MDKNIAGTKRINKTLFLVLMFCGASLTGGLFCISLFLQNYAVLRFWYLGFFVVTVGVIWAERRGKIKNETLAYYVFYALFAVYATLTSAFVTPDYVCVTILIFLFEIPILVFDRSSHVFLYEALIAALYLAVVLPRKAPHLITDEIINVAAFTLIGNATGTFFRMARLESMDLSRRLNLERTTDALTGLANRRMLFEYITAQENMPDAVPPYAVVMLDIDNFKRLNDTYGHAAGDACLHALGALLTAYGKEHGMDFYRYGGEEFVAILHREPPQGMRGQLEALNTAVRGMKVPYKALEGVVVTVSIGAVPVGAGGPVKYEQVIDRADKAMYTAKGMGRDRTVVGE